MSRPRFLADHDLNEHIVSGVRKRESDCEFWHSRDLGLRERPDAEILKYAAEAGLIVVSHDVKTMSAAAYSRIRKGELVSGLLLAIQNRPIAPTIEYLLLIWAATEAEEWIGTVTYLP